jgi:hypothetical protein
MNVFINLDDTYPFETLEPDHTKFTFKSPVLNGEPVAITVIIESAYDPFLKQFMNLAFGPEIDGKIDDFAAIHHTNPSKALSTVLVCGYKYLKANPKLYIGIDGSDFRRAYFYFRILQRNYTYLHQRFRIFGIKFYIRVIRGKDKNDQLGIDIKDLIHLPNEIENKPLTIHQSLYNYFFLYVK